MTPGSDGVLPDGFVEWECGVVYTVRPELLRRLQPQREYLLNVTVRRRVPADEESVDYARLYHRAAALARARLEIVAGRNGQPLHAWIQAHDGLANRQAGRSVHDQRSSVCAPVSGVRTSPVPESRN
jgi:hypothetical protein